MIDLIGFFFQIITYCKHTRTKLLKYNRIITKKTCTLLQIKLSHLNEKHVFLISKFFFKKMKFSLIFVNRLIDYG